jgi:hypothetical protein
MSAEAILVGTYDYRLIRFSRLVATVASCTALGLATRVSASHGRVRAVWRTGDSAGLGMGIWCLLRVIVAVASSLVALWLTFQLRERENTHSPGWQKLTSVLPMVEISTPGPVVIRGFMTIAERRQAEGNLRIATQGLVAQAKFRELLEAPPDERIGI